MRTLVLLSIPFRLALVLLHFCFFARRDDFGVARVVGQAGSLRPIVNRPNVANVQHSSFAACRYAGQVGNLRPIVNRPLAAELPYLLKWSQPTEEGGLTIRRGWG